MVRAAGAYYRNDHLLELLDGEFNAGRAGPVLRPGAGRVPRGGVAELGHHVPGPGRPDRRLRDRRRGVEPGRTGGGPRAEGLVRRRGRLSAATVRTPRADRTQTAVRRAESRAAIGAGQHWSRSARPWAIGIYPRRQDRPERTRYREECRHRTRTPTRCAPCTLASALISMKVRPASRRRGSPIGLGFGGAPSKSRVRLTSGCRRPVPAAAAGPSPRASPAGRSRSPGRRPSSARR